MSAGKEAHLFQPRAADPSAWLVLVQLQNTISSKLERLEGRISSQDRRIAANCRRLDALENKLRVAFEDVAASFSQEKWEYLKGDPKELHREAVKDNYETPISPDTDQKKNNPDILLRIKEEEEPYVWVPQESGMKEMTHSDTDHEAIQEEKQEKNPEDHPIILEPIPRESGNICENLPQRAERREISQSQQKSEKERRNPAGECGRSDGRLPKIPGHLRHHKRKENGKKSFLCETCGRRFDRKYCLLIHQRSHIGHKRFPCSECGKCFIQKFILKLHQKIHTEKKTFTCIECKKCFSRKESLVIHLRTHTRKKPFHCSEGEESYRSRFSLTKHQKMKTERTCVCCKSEDLFLQKENLVHQKGDTGKKQFNCPMCDKSFIYLSQLRRHHLTHTGLAREKRFPCTKCEKSFIYLSELKRHQLIHTGVKPFSCTECDRSFTQLSNMKRHQKIHMGVR
ncbi:zinc finger protein 182 [Microcaecilia unicolor]|uniref:Zinc finger protein 182-like n=1 Tax=Microcaecilia unicolor TaxID=1415580 RepID=A0A6P7XCH7_9AMPH|nr:zinc finger protein 182-like [Microcaecilia unicolor]